METLNYKDKSIVVTYYAIKKESDVVDKSKQDFRCFGEKARLSL